jgi:hypothetical protein
MALRSRTPPLGLLHHSDRGSQYASADYRAALQAAGIECSMSRKGRVTSSPTASFVVRTRSSAPVTLRSRMTALRVSPSVGPEATGPWSRRIGVQFDEKQTMYEAEITALARRQETLGIR